MDEIKCKGEKSIMWREVGTCSVMWREVGRCCVMWRGRGNDPLGHSTAATVLTSNLHMAEDVRKDKIKLDAIKPVVNSSRTEFLG